jgi:aldehyde:ferredoxin oxidoreductase
MQGVPNLVKETQDERAACFSLVLCDFLPFSVREMTEILNAATGLPYTSESYLATGERIWNLTRLFNLRESNLARNDVLPERFSTEVLPDGPAKGQKIGKNVFEKAKAEYYALRGWTRDGTPTREKLQSLGLRS